MVTPYEVRMNADNEEDEDEEEDEDGATWDMDESDSEPLPNPEAALEEYDRAMEEYNQVHGAAHHNNAHLQHSGQRNR